MRVLVDVLVDGGARAPHECDMTHPDVPAPTRPLRKLIGAWRKSLRPKRVRLRGLEVVSDAARIGSDMARWVYDGKYEAMESGIVAETVRPGDRVLDCGGGMGFVACVAARAAGPNGAVRVCEPNPALTPLIAENAATNGLTLEIRQVAVAAASGRLRFHVADQFVASSLSGEHGGSAIDAEVLAFADLCAEFRPSYLIIDIEGAEADLFDGVDLSGVRAACLEVHPKAIGALAASRPIARLIDAGLAIDFERSVKDVFYLERPEPR